MANYNGKELYVGAKSFIFEFEIRTVIEMDNNNIVLLSIPFNDSTINNIYCIDEFANVKWRVQDLNEISKGNNLPYEQMQISNGKIYASDFYGRCFIIDAYTGIIEGKKIVK